MFGLRTLGVPPKLMVSVWRKALGTVNCDSGFGFDFDCGCGGSCHDGRGVLWNRGKLHRRAMFLLGITLCIADVHYRRKQAVCGGGGDVMYGSTVRMSLSYLGPNCRYQIWWWVLIFCFFFCFSPEESCTATVSYYVSGDNSSLKHNSNYYDNNTTARYSVV